MSWVKQALLKTIIFCIIGTVGYHLFSERTPLAILIAALSEEIARAIPLTRGKTRYRVYALMGAIIGCIEGVCAGIPLLMLNNSIGHIFYGVTYEGCRRRWNGGAAIGICLMTALHFLYNSSDGSLRLLITSGQMICLIISSIVWAHRTPLESRIPPGTS